MRSAQYGICPFYENLQKPVDDYRDVFCCTGDCFIYFCKRSHKSNVDKLADEIFPVYDLRCDILLKWQEFIAGDCCSLGVESDFA